MFPSHPPLHIQELSWHHPCIQVSLLQEIGNKVDVAVVVVGRGVEVLVVGTGLVVVVVGTGV